MNKKELEEKSKNLNNQIKTHYENVLPYIEEIVYKAYSNKKVRSNKIEEIKTLFFTTHKFETYTDTIVRFVLYANDNKTMGSKKDLSAYSKDTEYGQIFEEVKKEISLLIDYKLFEYCVSVYSNNKLNLDLNILKIKYEKKEINNALSNLNIIKDINNYKI